MIAEKVQEIKLQEETCPDCGGELNDGNCIGYIYEIWSPRNERIQEITITIQDSNFGERKIATVTI